MEMYLLLLKTCRNNEFQQDNMGACITVSVSINLLPMFVEVAKPDCVFVLCILLICCNSV